MTAPDFPGAAWFRWTLCQRLILLAAAPSVAGLVIATSAARHTAVPGWLSTVDSAALLVPSVALAAVAVWKTLDAPLVTSTAVVVAAGVVGLAIATVGIYAGGLAAVVLLVLLNDPAALSAYLASTDLLIRFGRWAWQPRRQRP